MSDLVSFLESLVLSNSLIEKKYRDGVPTCVSTIDIHDSAIEDEDGPLKIKKRKSTKRIKTGKNGLYPSEEDLIRKWWSCHDDDADSGAPGTSREEVAKNRISQLRIRETQLQLIVILEVLALQPLASQTEDKGDSLPSVAPGSEPLRANEKQSKSKRPENLSNIIDVHIDRLCIWQSIQMEDVKATDQDSQNVVPGSLGAVSKHTDNILKDFCIEVIAPFFSGALSRPGAATKRPVPSKPRRSLQRVLTDERERRMAESQFGDSGRGQVAKSKQLARREVDLGSFNAATNAKAAKQAKIDAELKDAISALKKPNRELAGKALVETAERRSTSASHSRKSKKPVRNPLFQGIQISATPKTNRNANPGTTKDQRFSGAQLFSTVSDSVTKLPQESWSQLDVLETPIKKKLTNDVVHGHPTQSPRFDQENKTVLEAPNSISETPKKDVQAIYRSRDPAKLKDLNSIRRAAGEKVISTLLETINCDALRMRAETLRDGVKCTVNLPSADQAYFNFNIVGGRNYHGSIVFEDGKTCEFATYRFLAGTGVLVSEVYDCADDEDPMNIVGAGYILLEKLPGKPLEWYKASEAQKEKFAGQLADIYTKLEQHPLDKHHLINILSTKVFSTPSHPTNHPLSSSVM
ncbi:hypothetical protein M7I_1490 [Glarea lozoyensis 74030]|uniref:DNA replication regulator Sld3 C-terminal domain-containing protein n=1 Tax=Glarea lozoyensis (strain ATCC 74030 / MF5533) TaxID=1104152 RepID=H0EG80_GLAL7|nr:hypothetical protein M7I_1490 [Glarea lozoyensis 74030]